MSASPDNRFEVPLLDETHFDAVLLGTGLDNTLLARSVTREDTALGRTEAQSLIHASPLLMCVQCPFQVPPPRASPG